MRKYNPKNERIKRKYFEFQKEANQRCQSTIDNIRKAIDRYELYTKYQDFKTFNKEKAIAFKKHIAGQKSVRTDEFLSKSTVLSTLNHLKDFFKWLSREKGYRRMDIRIIDYFNLSEKEERAAKAKKREKVPTIEQIKAVINSMPSSTDIERRNKALIAFTLLTGIRDSAIASLSLKHINLQDNIVEQTGMEVSTKFGKTIFTYFFPVDDDIEHIVVDWVNYLYKEKLFNGNSPLFPRTKLVLDKNNSFVADGIEPIHWKSTNQIRKIFKEAFERTGFEYFTPHSFRNTLVRFGEELCKTPEEFKAWSQNLGHEQVLTTFCSYGYIPEYNQGEIIKRLGRRNIGKNTKNKLEEIREILEK